MTTDTRSTDLAPGHHHACTYCGSGNVRLDAFAAWDFEEQRWVLGELYDAAHCVDCGGETSLKQVEGAPPEPNDELEAIDDHN